MKKKILCLCLALILAGGVFLMTSDRFVTSAVTASSVEDARDQIDDIQKHREELKKELNDLAAQKADYLSEKSVVDRQINALNDEIELYDQMIGDLDSQIAARETAIAEAQATYDANIDKYKTQARATYEAGEVSYAEVLLGAGSFSDFLLRVDYMKQQAAYVDDLLRSIRQSIQTIREEQAALQEERALQVSARSEAEDRRKEVESAQSRIQSLVNKVKKSESSLKAIQQREAEEEEKLNAYIEKELSGAKSDVIYQEGAWYWPVGKASYNYVSSGFGWRTLYKKKEFHYAIDIAAPAKTPVYATKAGVVKSAGWVTTGGGWQVCIDHGGSYYSYYNHMYERPLVKAGQAVKQGEKIGLVGMTGTATGNHLDFKIYYNGKAQNPLNYVKNPY